MPRSANQRFSPSGTRNRGLPCGIAASLPHGRLVEVVVVVVRDQHQVDVRQFVDVERQRGDAPRPDEPSGEARSENIGSVSIVWPASRTSTVAWPIQVTDGLASGARSAAGSVFTAGRFQPPAGGLGTPLRSRSHCQAQKLAFSGCG